MLLLLFECALGLAQLAVMVCMLVLLLLLLLLLLLMMLLLMMKMLLEVPVLALPYPARKEQAWNAMRIVMITRAIHIYIYT